MFIREETTLSTDNVIGFLEAAAEAYPAKKQIPIFCDHASYQKSKKVKKHLKDSKIKLHFLPPYSPNLNPIERLWKWMKKRVIYNNYYEDFCSFKLAVLEFF